MQEAQILTHGLHWALAHLWHNFALNEMGTYLLNPTVHYGPPISAQTKKGPIGSVKKNMSDQNSIGRWSHHKDMLVD